jgi:2Fe-2S ferredoxin
MVKIKLVEANGTEHEIMAKPGLSLMENAVKNAVPGIVADCGGICACATCRVYIKDPQWRAKTGEASEDERGMVEIAGDTNDGVRLSCQIEVTEELDGLTVVMPESQY